MKRYKQLTIEQRYQIYGLKKAGFNQSEIAVEVKVDKGTISRELKRNSGKRGWHPSISHAYLYLPHLQPVHTLHDPHNSVRCYLPVAE